MAASTLTQMSLSFDLLIPCEDTPSPWADQLFTL